MTQKQLLAVVARADEQELAKVHPVETHLLIIHTQDFGGLAFWGQYKIHKNGVPDALKCLSTRPLLPK